MVVGLYFAIIVVAIEIDFFYKKFDYIYSYLNNYHYQSVEAWTVGVSFLDLAGTYQKI